MASKLKKSQNRPTAWTAWPFVELNIQNSKIYLENAIFEPHRASIRVGTEINFYNLKTSGKCGQAKKFMEGRAIKCNPAELNERQNRYF